MENNKYEVVRRPRLAASLLSGFGALILTGCPSGQQETPTPKDVTRDMDYFILPGVTAENGEPVRCALYAEATDNTSYSKSWFGFSCDYAGTAVFPGVIPQTPVTVG